MQIKKTIFLVNVDNYAPEITELTYPFIELYARKIGAEICHITERKFPHLPPVMEKLQIYEIAQKMQSDWNIYIDSDALIHPEMIDWTVFLKKDTIAHNATDMAAVRWKYDRFFMRDGRNIGSCNWFTIASDWCIELWKPIDDMNDQEILDSIFQTIGELNTVISIEHLMDDYTLSRNIAKYGFKVKRIRDLSEELLPGSNFMWHAYLISREEKVKQLKQVIKDWGIYRFFPERLQKEIAKLPSI